MAANSSFARARQYARQHGASTVGLFLTGLLTTIALVLLLIDVAAVAGLLASGGRVVASGDELAVVESLAGEPARRDGEPGSYENAGLLPLWVGMRDRPAGNAVGRLYRRFPSLRTNRSALVWLVVSGLFLTAWFCMSRYLVLRGVRHLGERVAARMRYDIYR